MPTERVYPDFSPRVSFLPRGTVTAEGVRLQREGQSPPGGSVPTNRVGPFQWSEPQALLVVTVLLGEDGPSLLSATLPIGTDPFGEVDPLSENGPPR